MERAKLYSSLGIENVSVKETISRSLNDPTKIRKLLQTVQLPNSYRIVIYRTIFNIIPNQGEYNLLLENNDFFYPEYQKPDESLVKMLLVKNWDQSPFELLKMGLPLHLVCISRAFLHIFKDLQVSEIFWLFNGFIVNLNAPFRPQIDITDFVILFRSNMPELYNYLTVTKVKWSRHVEMWMLSYYACIISFDTLESLWDIVISGDKTFVLYLGLSCLQNLNLMGKTLTEIEDRFTNASKNLAHQKVAAEAIIKWRKSI